MFTYCTALTTAPELPATTLADGCYTQMFSNCTALTTAPALPATTLASFCYQGMFSGCTALSSVTMLATNVSAVMCLENWLNGAGTNVQEGKIHTLTLNNQEVRNKIINYLPEGWSVRCKY